MAFDPSYSPAPRSAVVFFDRRELDLLMRLYGRMVGAGEWRDYAISGLADMAVFAVYRTAFVRDGAVQFRKDLYGWDAKLLELLD